MLKHLFPIINKSDILEILKFAFTGATIAGVYGIIHDQITYSISHEYFTKFKFTQFIYADFGINDRFFVGTIGFIATWWVGFFVGWFLGRRFVPGQSRHKARQKIFIGFIVVFVLSVTFAFSANIYVTFLDSESVLSNWFYTLDHYGISTRHAFIRVAYIHNSSYLGALIGLLITLTLLKPNYQHFTDT
jgi:hypothetical protein